MAEPGSQQRGDGEREQQTAATAVSVVTGAQPGARAVAAAGAPAEQRLDQGVREPEEAEREQDGRCARRPRPPGLEPAGDDQHLARRRAATAAAPRARRARCPSEAPSARLRAARYPPTAWPAARGSCASSGVAA